MAKSLVSRYSPYPKQAIFHSCPADDALYGGAAGGGKTEALINEGYQTAIDYPGARVILFRRTTKQLRKAIDTAKATIPRQVAVWRESEGRFRFRNTSESGLSSTFIFSHMEHEDNATDHQGEEYDLILWDERTHFTSYQTSYLQSRSRTTVPGSKARIRSGTNPGGVGHLNAKDRYIEPPVIDAELLYFWSHPNQPNHPDARWLRFPKGYRGRPAPYIVWAPDTDEDTERANEQRAKEGLDPLPKLSRAFIQAFLKDNPHYHRDGAYEATLRELPADQRRALLEGDWSVFVGQAFPEFKEGLHVIDPITPRPHWPRWRSMDWGYASPLCVLWHALDPETGQIVTYDELYYAPKNAKEGERDVVARVLSRTPAHDAITQTVADPSMWSGGQGEDQLSKAEIYARNGLDLTPANNDRKTGKDRVHELQRINPATGKPNWVVTRNCRNLIRTLPALVYDDKRIEDIDTKGEDHAYDALRYGLMARPTVTGGIRWGTITAGSFYTPRATSPRWP